MEGKPGTAGSLPDTDHPLLDARRARRVRLDRDMGDADRLRGDLLRRLRHLLRHGTGHQRELRTGSHAPGREIDVRNNQK